MIVEVSSIIISLCYHRIFKSFKDIEHMNISLYAFTYTLNRMHRLHI